VGAIISLLAGEYRLLAVAGGVLLIVLGIRIALERPQIEEARTANGTHLAWAYVSTLGLTITNPPTIISFAALAATLGNGIGGGLLRPALVVAGVLLGSATWWCVLAAAASVLRTRISARVVRGIGAFSGAAIAALGLAAAVSALAG